MGSGLGPIWVTLSLPLCLARGLVHNYRSLLLRDKLEPTRLVLILRLSQFSWL